MDEERAPERNQRLAELLADAGLAVGLTVEFEYPVPGGRIDVVWLWEGPEGFPVRLPVVGFEVESSWRTRKHIKGDLLNLMDLQPALGIIVLAGAGPNVEATKRFARSMVQRRVCRIEIWDETEVAALAKGGSSAAKRLVVDLPVQAVTPTDVGAVGGTKYAALSAWLAGEKRQTIEASFREIEEVLGFPLPPSSRRYVAHWHGYKGSAVVRAIKDAGWLARNVDLAAERLVLERDRAHRTEP
jgi:hypothetical protein